MICNDHSMTNRPLLIHLVLVFLLASCSSGSSLNPWDNPENVRENSRFYTKNRNAIFKYCEGGDCLKKKCKNLAMTEDCRYRGSKYLQDALNKALYEDSGRGLHFCFSPDSGPFKGQQSPGCKFKKNKMTSQDLWKSHCVPESKAGFVCLESEGEPTKAPSNSYEKPYWSEFFFDANNNGNSVYRAIYKLKE